MKLALQSGLLLAAGAGTSADRFVRMVYSQLQAGK